MIHPADEIPHHQKQDTENDYHRGDQPDEHSGFNQYDDAQQNEHEPWEQ
jgi:hypothetical protein